jgi:hypothetical protein
LTLAFKVLPELSTFVCYGRKKPASSAPGQHVELRFEWKEGLVPQGAFHTVSTAGVSPKFETKQADIIGTKLLSVALIGPDRERRSVMAKALAGTRRANVREFDSYPPKREHLRGLLASFEVVILDLDSDLDVALELVERASADNAPAIMVYSEKRSETRHPLHACRCS